MEASQLNQEAALAASFPETPDKPENASSESVEALSGNSGATLPIIAASWPKNQREMLQVRIDTYQGRNVIDVRTWYPDADGNLKPAKGLTVSLAHLPALAAGLAVALEIARRRGLLEGGKE